MFRIEFNFTMYGLVYLLVPLLLSNIGHGTKVNETEVADIDISTEKPVVTIPNPVVDSPTPNGCPLLPELENGHYEIHSGGLKVKPICDEEYNLIGTKILRCISGKWNYEYPPRCRLPSNICEKPAEVANAKMVYDGRKIGTSVFYVCDPGYYMVGDKIQTCTAGRYWSGITPKCFPNVLESKEVVNMLKHHLDPNITESDAKLGRILGPEVFDLGLELFFVIDRSSSIDPIDLNSAKKFIKQLIGIFKGNEDRINGTRICVITFGTNVTVNIPLNDDKFSNINVTLKQIDAIQGEGGGTAMEEALSTVFLQGGLRNRAKKALFLVTDGEPNIGAKGVTPESHANELKQMDFEIYCIGVGSDISRDTLTKIATAPAINHVLMLTDYKSFEKAVDLIQNPLTTPAPPPPPGPESCGYLGDSEKDEKEPHPWLAAIYAFINDKIRFCSGVLINDQWVLTSAICIQPHKHPINDLDVTIVLGGLDLYKEGLNFYAIQKNISLPDTLPELRLALLKLDRKIPLGLKYKPICLPSPKEPGVLHQMDLAKNFSIEGWGSLANQKADKKLSLSGSYVSPIARRVWVNDGFQDDCANYMARKYKHEREKSGLKIKEIAPKYRCIGSRDEDLKLVRMKKPPVCSGNFGSPLVMKETQGQFNRYYLAGIQSSEFGCSDYTSLYMYMPYYVTWISKFL